MVRSVYESIRRLGIVIAIVATATWAGTAAAQKDPPGGGGGGAVGGSKIGNYRMNVFPLDKYEPLENAKFLSTMSPTTYLWYYYTFQNISLPAEFNFKYFGQQVKTVYAVSGGALGIGNGTSVYGNHSLPNASAPSGTLAPFWDYLSGTQADTYRPGIRWEVVGEGDDQIFKIEWSNMYNYYCYRVYGTYYGACEDAMHFNFQIWIYQATGDTDSLIQYRFGKITNPNGTPDAYSYNGSPSGYVEGFTIAGIESPDNATGLQPWACGINCKVSDFPEMTMVQFGQGADLTSTVLSGPAVGYSGVPLTTQAVAQNIGGTDAVGFGAKLWVSEDTTLDITDQLVAAVPPDVDAPTPDAAGLFSAATDAQVTIDFTGELPRSLLEGQGYYLLSEADPASDNHPIGLVREDLEVNNTGAYGPFVIGPPTPDLAVTDLTTDVLTVSPGGTIFVDWVAHNYGNAPVDAVPYWVVLSVEDVITPSDTVIGTGFLRVDELSDLPVGEEFAVPPTTRPGVYHLGIVIDPENQQNEIDDFNNVGILGDLVLIGSDSVSITSGTLPDAYVAAPYCQSLVAAGGNGTFVWTAKDVSSLPPGLALREEPADARAKGKPFDTLLCGVPALKGNFEFDMNVTSAGKTVSKKLNLAVKGEVPPLAIVTQELPSATFQVGYEASLYATGGAPPYSWELQQDSTPLPRGVSLRNDGRIVGMPQLDGRFPFRVQVTDSLGTVATGEMYVAVTPPGRLTCVSQALDGARVGEEYTTQLYAAGGNKPYIWSTVETRRLAEGVSDSGETVPDLPPPGLVLAESGSVSGTPSSSGSFLWTAKVTDQLQQEDVCVLSLEFSSGALNVITGAVPVVCANDDYSVQLEASGGDGGFLTWSLDENSSLPDGLELTPDGMLAGNVSAEVLEGNPFRTFNVTVHAKDSSNAKGVGAVALRVTQCADITKVLERRIVKKTGCGSQASGGALSLMGLAALALLGLRRRR